MITFVLGRVRACKNLNADIETLVEQGLRAQVQQAADLVRVTGNDAVHPGQIDTADEDVALSLLDLINVITEDRLTQPRRIQAMFDSLPDGKRQQIEKRDKAQSANPDS